MGNQSSSLKIRPRRGRGSADAEAIKSALLENWEDVQSYLASFSDTEKDEIKDHFNKLFDGDYEELGNSLFGTAEDFAACLVELNDEDMKTFANELLSKNAIDQAYLTSD